ncbi:hypothetical protein ACFQE5_01545 [Pseudonocardia hispaniensis]|uniref:Uncharacterized protein n=1 Tax=Pseudonocardia hispaniensis TaxID=904933 RepID=A0ABW1IXK2_9PSEU
MNISEASNLNVLLDWLFELPSPDGHIPSHEEGRAAAAWLADRAHTAISAGMTGAKVLKNWYWFDDPDDLCCDETGCGCADIEPPARAVETVQVTGERL